MPDLQPEAIQKRCTRFLGYHYQLPPAQALAELAASAGPSDEADRYGAGELIAGFEQEIANLLGKPTAVFMPSGTMCQPIALRIWADRRGVRNVAFHPTCHLEIHEHKGYQLLHGLHGVLVGSPHHLMTLDDLRAVADPLAALLIELPQREIGGQLPAWDDLVALTSYTRERGIALHLDGARLWECQPFYGRPYAAIAALFDTVYVSFYKILGGIAGAVLAGPADVIAEARIWQRRQGGNLVRLFPYVLSARQGLAQRLDRMATYYQKAIEVAATLGQFAQIQITPNPPHTNMMHVFLRGDRERLIAAALEVAGETGVWLFGRLAPTQLPAYQKLELTVGDATVDLTSATIAELFGALFRKAEAEHRS